MPPWAPQVDSAPVAAWLADVLGPHLPAGLRDGQVQLQGLNERLRILCYSPGQFFAEHFDGTFVRQQPHPRSGDFSAVTVQIYLHSVPSENGGATTLWPDSPHRHPVQPTAGSVLLLCAP